MIERVFPLTIVLAAVEWALFCNFSSFPGRPRFFLTVGGGGEDPDIFLTIMGQSINVKDGISKEKKGSILSNIV